VLRIQQEQLKMNKDQIKGVERLIAGKMQEEAGKLLGSKKQQVKGLSKQIAGERQKNVGDATQAVEKAAKG
jgi:uncharacterized protein YjbJ (UPF0337 family)